MGKTIEAGLLLWPLLANRKVQRVLILSPAKLVSQWQMRLKRMFDIRAATYHSDLDTDRTDFWGIHQIVVASLPTLRADRNGRHERLLDAPGWDMVLVDEAHHLYADEETGKTLGFELVERLNMAGKIASCVLFTGTPHRGKSFGFWSLMSLLDAEHQQSLLYSSDLELGEATRQIFEVVERVKPTRVVIDSLSEIRLLAQSSLRYRRQILAIKHYFVRYDATVLLHAALADGGISLQPTYLASSLLQDGRLQQVLPDWQPPPMTIHALYPSRRHLSPAVRTLLDFLVDWFTLPRW